MGRYATETRPDTATVLPATAIDYPEEILDTFRRSLSAIEAWLRDGDVDPADHFGAATPGR